ncbi:MAG: glycoside hydrolase family 13 protein [Trueperaceae bacterium]
MNKYQLDRVLQMPHGETLPFSLSHHPSRREDFDFRPDGYVYLRLRAESGIIRSGEVVTLRNEQPETSLLVHRYGDSNQEVWESVSLELEEGCEYYFRLQTITGQALFGATGLQASLPKEARFRVAELEPSTVPAWARGAAFYQIFPDRFHRGREPKNAPSYGLEPWGSDPTATGFKGGTLAGITEKLGYLERLGINALWLNPVFSSPSNHRYDTTDFFAIDQRLGTADDLGLLVREAHARGIKVILDGVFNHVSEEHLFFKDVVERGRESPYWDWFRVRRWPIEEHSDDSYATWWGHGHLPQLDLDNPQVQQYFLDVGVHWLEEHDIDGWRLDVAGEVPLDFWRRFRSVIRAAKSDAYLLAEVWGDGRNFLQGDSFDATMNYSFRRIVLEFLCGGLDASKSAAFLNRLYYRYPREIAEAQYNLLGSHDVSRLSHDLGGDLHLVELAFVIQCGYPGSTALYYGDEIAMAGEGDPGCRRAFPWTDAGDAGSQPLRDAVARFLALRKEEPVLRNGLVHCTATDNDTLLIKRSLANDSVTLSVNRATGCYDWLR